MSIGKHKYNIFCYADDILLASTTVSGLQRLINTANHFITNHGLRFNPVKTDCFIMGRHHFYKDPIFVLDGHDLKINHNVNYLGAVLDNVLDGHDLKINHNVNYLGAVLDNVKGKSHVSNRIGSCHKLFYALQGAVLCNTGLNVDTATYIWSNTCKNVLLYACESIFLSKQRKQDLDKLQARLIKCIIGIGPSHKTTPLLQALKIQNISDAIDYNNIVLLRNIICASSAARNLNCHMLQYNRNCKGTLVNRVSLICQTKTLINIELCLMIAILDS